jgi:hypothetical protein
MNSFIKNNSLLLTTNNVEPPAPPLESFDYVYKILDLIYMVNIQNSIYNLDYDLSSGSIVTMLNNSYVYENEKVYSWF